MASCCGNDNTLTVKQDTLDPECESGQVRTRGETIKRLRGRKTWRGFSGCGKSKDGASVAIDGLIPGPSVICPSPWASVSDWV